MPAQTANSSNAGETHSLTDEEVASWFPESRFGRPKPEHCVALTNALQLAWLLRVHPQALNPVLNANARLFEAARACREAKVELESALRQAGPHYRGTEIQHLITAIDSFLAIGPASKSGRPAASWQSAVTRLLPLAVAALKANGLGTPSASSDKGPVVGFMVVMLRKCSGQQVSATTIGRWLRQTQTR